MLSEYVCLENPVFYNSTLCDFVIDSSFVARLFGKQHSCYKRLIEKNILLSEEVKRHFAIQEQEDKFGTRGRKIFDD